MPAEKSQNLASQRGVPLDGHEANLDHLRNAEQTYIEIAGIFDGFKVIECMDGDVMLPPDKIHALVWRELAPILSR